ncbi:hypothetical protein WQ54_24005 [Bacillus sp. SA1-12]|uniref:lactonase family protein n=1 Tax=Bacillus sp. SA1-12 TaxID=1455638 RepID=UPI0006271E44|nr:lactonase family protein [Bacillus sp. SA1-12]KKI89798.1 hypothetical protein WQ54_24005 [Bacillus sp. SA1-12]
MNNSETMYMFVGSYTNKDSKGINIFTFHLGTGEIEYFDSVGGIKNPSFLTVDPNNQYLYAVSETSEGKVASYEIDQTSGKLSPLSEQTTIGSGPCYLTTNRRGDCLLAVNYGGGSVCAFPINNGVIGRMTDFVEHQGSSINLERQEGPHPHSVVLDLLVQYAFVPDLGKDKIVIYKFDQENCRINFHHEINTLPGAGPRHLIFHPYKPYAYVINELDSTITVYYQNTLGHLTPIQSISAVPILFKGNTCADIHIAPSGKFLYCSNRGHDSIAIYSIDHETGKLKFIDYTSTRGKTPRNFCLSPNGKYLIVANQDSDSIVTFEIDQKTGQLSEPISTVNISEPVCIKFMNNII